MIMVRKELNEYYEQKFGKKIASSTLSKWVAEGKLKAIKQSNGTYDYDFESFKSIVDSPDYSKQMKAKKSKPEDYIGKQKGDLLIKGIVPYEERNDKSYSGTIMYCDCLACGRKKVQIRFSYLTENGNYHKTSCGCDRKQRAFISTIKQKLELPDLSFCSENFEKFLLIHTILTNNTNAYYLNCSKEEYLQTVKYFYSDKQFNSIYDFWISNKNKDKTYYDWAKPSLDHKIPKSRGGTDQLNNLQILTVFENLAKRDMTWEEWNNFKKETKTHSDYFIENFIKEE